MRKSVVMLMILAVSFMAGCAGSTQTTTARTLLTIHDSIKTGAAAADAACDQRLLKAEWCAEIKVAYDAFREEWPKTSDSLKIYLQTPSVTNKEKFNAHYTLFMKTYQQIFAALLKHGVITMTEGGK